MKITIYTITECPFSKQEREYLSSHSLQFEEKNLETNREFLAEMLAVGSNFAGTPVTKIEKDDGQIVVLKGFTAAEFDKTLGLTSTPPVETVAAAESVLPVQPAGLPPVEVVPPTVTEQSLPPAPQAEPAAVATSTPVDPAMTSVLNTLEQQAQIATPVAPVAPVPVAPIPPAPGGTPIIPDPQF